MHEQLEVGDSVWTLRQFHCRYAYDPQTGDWIEVRLPRKHHLKVANIYREEETITVQLPNGYMADFGFDELESIGPVENW